MPAGADCRLAELPKIGVNDLVISGGNQLFGVCVIRAGQADLLYVVFWLIVVFWLNHGACQKPHKLIFEKRPKDFVKSLPEM